MNSAGGKPQIAGAVAYGGHNNAAPAHFQVGAVGFGPSFDDDEVQLTHAGWKSVTDGMAASIVRLEQEAEELRAEVALLREQARLLQAERDEARIQYRSTLALAEVLAKTQVKLKAERDEARALLEASK